MKFFKEIKAVGFKDWCWFTFYLQRNEFNRKLDMFAYFFTHNRSLKGLEEERERAHKIDMKIRDIGK